MFGQPLGTFYLIPRHLHLVTVTLALYVSGFNTHTDPGIWVLILLNSTDVWWSVRDILSIITLLFSLLFGNGCRCDEVIAS